MKIFKKSFKRILASKNYPLEPRSDHQNLKSVQDFYFKNFFPNIYSNALIEMKTLELHHIHLDFEFKF